jgi:hypothetical protein
MRWTGLVSRKAECRFCSENLQVRDHLEDLGVEFRIILKRMGQIRRDQDRKKIDGLL